MSNYLSGVAAYNNMVSGHDLSGIRSFIGSTNDNYLVSLVHPQGHVAKIPTMMPISSTTARLKYNFTITPNTSGKFVLVIDPFQNVGYLSVDNALDGTGPGTWQTINFGQDATIVDQWRLVSSGVQIRYFGNFNVMSGIFVAATTSNVSNATADTFKTFQNIEDLSNKKVINCMDGVNMIYSPMDTKATDFTSSSTYTNNTHPCKWQYLFVVYGDLFPNTSCIRVDFVRNIEYTTFPNYREYITQTTAPPELFNAPVGLNTVTTLNNVGASGIGS